MRYLDPVETEYKQAIALATARGDSDLACELTIGLKQYRELYKDAPDPLSRRSRA